MGCDISLHCEYRKDGVWYNCDNFEWNQDTKEYEFMSIYWHRNYDLFGVLAGVRCHDFDTISAPKGLPDDIALKTKQMADADMDWTHSHSYLTMRELLNWKYEQKKKWKKLLKKHKNRVMEDAYWGEFVEDSEGYAVFKYEHKLLDGLIRKMKDKMGDHLYVFEEDDYWTKGDDFRIVFWFDN